MVASRFHTRCRPFLIVSVWGLMMIVIVALSPFQGLAQITLDGTMGPAGSLKGPNYVIGDNLGKTKGSNLFHSFGKFNVWTGESASFTGPDSIKNVIGRVTGGSQSNIDGLLRSNINGANLFLLNPSGMVFGPNASLDVKGSFHASTADYLKFSDGKSFYADPSKPTVLSVAPVQSFGFLSQHPAGVSISAGTLKVPEGKLTPLSPGISVLRMAQQ